MFIVVKNEKASFERISQGAKLFKLLQIKRLYSKKKVFNFEEFFLSIETRQEKAKQVLWQPMFVKFNSIILVSCNHGATTSPVLSTNGNKFFVVEKLNSR